jgi:hypothetical protein
MNDRYLASSRPCSQTADEIRAIVAAAAMTERELAACDAMRD